MNPNVTLGFQHLVKAKPSSSKLRKSGEEKGDGGSPAAAFLSPNDGVPAGVLIHWLVLVRHWPIFGWWRSNNAQTDSSTLCCHPSGGTWWLLWSMLLLTVARLGAM